MQRGVLNVSWQNHETNDHPYGTLPSLSTIVKKRHHVLCGHVRWHGHHAAEVFLWKPEAKCKINQARITLPALSERDTGLPQEYLIAAMSNQQACRQISNVTE